MRKTTTRPGSRAPAGYRPGPAPGRCRRLPACRQGMSARGQISSATSPTARQRHEEPARAAACRPVDRPARRPMASTSQARDGTGRGKGLPAGGSSVRPWRQTLSPPWKTSTTSSSRKKPCRDGAGRTADSEGDELKRHSRQRPRSQSQASAAVHFFFFNHSFCWVKIAPSV